MSPSSRAESMPKEPKKKIKGAQPSNEPKGFDEGALAKLTSKLDKSLSANDHKRKKPPTNASSKQQSKRQRASEAIPPQDGSKDRQDDQAALLAEIKALGGDEQDLELINEVDSDDENYAQDSKRSVDKNLKQELAALSKELGFAEFEPQEASDEGEIQDEDEDEDEDEEDEDADDADEPPAETDNGGANRKPGGMIFEPLAEWHAASLGKLPGPTSDQLGPFTSSVESLKKHAKSLLEQDTAKYRTSVFASSSHKFLSTIMSSGTLTDKVSALTLAVQESPVHNIRALDALLNLASKKSRAQAIGAIGALVDLFGPGTLLPSDRRLRAFQSQPGLGTLQRKSVKTWSPGQPLPGKITEAHLVAWIYEDWLKETYFKIIQLLESWCSDEIEYSRMKAVDFVYGLLKEKPEQESNLLKLLVNKLGDRDRKISSRASYLLLQLQVSHPGMKPIVIRMVEQDILLRPSQDARSRYCAINTLNQTILSSKEPSVAEELIRIYFDLFVTLLKTGVQGKPVEKKHSKPGTPKPPVPDTEAADKLVSAILTGVNRAAPFVTTNDAFMEHHLDTLFKIAHSTNLNTAIQALLLIQHLASARNLATDRFYRTLYESLLDPRLVTSSKQALYLNLLLRSLKSDVDVRRVKAFAKRMLQIAGLHQPPFICGLLYVISSLRQTFPDLSTLVDEPETSVFDDDESKEQGMYDGRKRNPEHSNAQRSCLWEMVPAQMHFHPSVKVSAAVLLDKDRKMPKPDLESHSLIRFLDKFVYKNPKSTHGARGVSIMQPLRATKDLGDVWLGSKGAGATTAPLNSATFWKKKVEDVAAEDIFFHEYFQHVSRDTKEPLAKAPADGDDENAEDEIWEALVSTQPDIEADGDLEDEDEDGEDDGDEGSSDGLVAVGEDDEEEAKDEDTAKTKRSRRKALRDLPMFASVDDYAELLGGEEEGV
ncbi:CBF/Mak21 family domain-containing protein [Hirsutella rhossiliensis]|uniref:CBF/Mak21 family domain-containing protein n=1 Tax=Hirsutella rhossiliensis TaxID=111463 RepID=A0A9P8MT04_9HYPO|nr:CBF/Mak21 family domain-containing protein [Hirsutella rhossiliensis]KAH0960624.1 CBF/Mak21 family domain-containing protein [Hirsutella rhossiliensis]